MILTFDAEAARNLLAVSRASSKRRPCFEQLYDPRYWRDDMDPARRAKLMESLRGGDYLADISEEDVDPTRIPAGLWIVGDQGVYLMSNAPIEEVRAAGYRHVVYAREVDPETMPVDVWWAAKKTSFGADDGVDFIGAETLDKALTGTALEIDVTPKSMSILKPRDEALEP